MPDAWAVVVYDPADDKATFVIDGRFPTQETAEAWAERHELTSYAVPLITATAVDLALSTATRPDAPALRAAPG